MEYLTRWRMLVAGERLTRGDEPVSAIAHALGYASEAAFSTAFKRLMGSAPRAFAARRRAEATTRLAQQGGPPARPPTGPPRREI